MIQTHTSSNGFKTFRVYSYSYMLSKVFVVFPQYPVSLWIVFHESFRGSVYLWTSIIYPPCSELEPYPCENNRRGDALRNIMPYYTGHAIMCSFYRFCIPVQAIPRSHIPHPSTREMGSIKYFLIPHFFLPICSF